MKRLGLAIVAGALSAACCASVYAEEAQMFENAKLYYDNGVRLEFDNFDMKLNVQLQPRYTYNDFDNNDAFERVEDSSEFNVRRGRWIVSGNALENDQFSYKLEYDFADDFDDEQLKDAWLQWNHDVAKIRFGRQRVAFSREARISSERLFFVDRSAIAIDTDAERNTGLSVRSNLGPANIELGIYNGETDGNTTKHQYAGSIDFSSDTYGDRGMEGDLRDEEDLGFTMGASIKYDQAEAAGIDFDALSLNGDLGLRVASLDIQGEYFYTEFDDDTPGSSSEDASGFYVQAMYVMDKLGFGGRFVLENPTDSSGLDDVIEYSLVANYFLNGHYLKLQNQISFVETSLNSGEDVTDFRYDLQLAAFF